MSLQYGELRPTNDWDRLAGLRQPSIFQRVSRLGFVRGCSTQVNQTLHDAWPSPVPLHYFSLYIHFRELLPPKGIFQLQIHFASKCCVLFWQLHGTVAWGKLCGVILGMALRNFRTRAQPIFCWVAITLGIGPHSSI